MASMSELLPKFFVHEGSDKFLSPNVLQEYRPFFKIKMQYNFPSTVKLSPLVEGIVACLSEDSA
ncbi:hypothetical protein KSC_108710 [Ktedonobacter sp. SOSP1-52]|nr:hypothetical protein KSC_108710 [Ktedonobacter sp. SOSP1-52]